MSAARKAVLYVTAVIEDAPEKLDEALAVAGDNGSLGIQKVCNVLESVAGGVRAGNVYVTLDKVTPAATNQGAEFPSVTVTLLTLASIVTGEPFYLGDVTFNFRTTATLAAAGSTLVFRGANTTAGATNLASKINSAILTRHLYSASATANRVTITARQPGRLGRFRVASADATAIGVGGGVTAEETLAAADGNTLVGVSSRTYQFKRGVGS